MAESLLPPAPEGISPEVWRGFLERRSFENQQKVAALQRDMEAALAPDSLNFKPDVCEILIMRKRTENAARSTTAYGIGFGSGNRGA